MKNLVKWLTVLAIVSAGSALAADKKIERVFKAKCAACHGMDGKGQTEKGKKMKVADLASEAVQKKTDEEMTKVINEGFKEEKEGVKKEMDPYKDELKPEELTGLIKMIREFKK